MTGRFSPCPKILSSLEKNFSPLAQFLICQFSLSLSLSLSLSFFHCQPLLSEICFNNNCILKEGSSQRYLKNDFQWIQYTVTASKKPSRQLVLYTYLYSFGYIHWCCALWKVYYTCTWLPGQTRTKSFFPHFSFLFPLSLMLFPICSHHPLHVLGYKIDNRTWRNPENDTFEEKKSPAKTLELASLTKYNQYEIPKHVFFYKYEWMITKNN